MTPSGFFVFNGLSSYCKVGFRDLFSLNDVVRLKKYKKEKKQSKIKMLQPARGH